MVSLQAIVLFASATVGQQAPVLLDFTASWCKPCQQMRPAIEQLKAAGYPIQEVDYDERQDLARQYQVTSVPTFVLVANGRVVARQSGACSPRQLAGMFTALRAPTENVAQAPVKPRGPILPNTNPPMLQAPPLDPPPTQAPVHADVRAGFNVAAAAPQNYQARPAGTSSMPRTAPPLSTAAEHSSAVAVNQSRSAPPHAPARTLQGPPPQSTQFAPPAMQAPPATQFTAAPAASPAPTTDADTAERMAMHATVRIEVKDEGGASVATGTIIDQHGGELLVLTCGHVFKSSKGKGQILVDTFYPGGAQDIPGQLVAWEVKDRDVGLISFRPTVKPQVAKIALQKNYRKGDLVFSIGCDHGDDPTMQMTKITSIDRYHGASNIEIAGQPVDGRSGGGLFTSEGELIGVCNAADPTDDEGIYAALPAIQKHLVANGMRHLVTGQPQAGRLAAQPTSPAPSNRSLTDSMPARGFSDAPPIRNISANGGASANVPQSSAETEVIVVIRPAGGPERVMTIREPSRELLQQMKRESGGAERSSGPIMSAGRMTPIIRGQSMR